MCLHIEGLFVNTFNTFNVNTLTSYLNKSSLVRSPLVQEELHKVNNVWAVYFMRFVVF